MVTKSRALMRCNGSGHPVEFPNDELFIPNSIARLVIWSAKAVSVPAIFSATVMHASLPDCTIIPCIKSRTDTLSPSRKNIVDPPILVARSETKNSVSIAIRSSLNASNSMNKVISFDIDAGGTLRSASLAISIVPVVWSITIAERAIVSNALTGDVSKVIINIVIIL